MKLIIILSLLLATSLGGSLAGRMPIDNPDRTAVTDHDRALIKYYLSGMRGLWAGYMHVFHHGAYALDDKCFKEESAHEVMEILNFLVYGGLSELMLTADAARPVAESASFICSMSGEMETPVGAPEAPTIRNKIRTTGLFPLGRWRSWPW